MTNRQQALYELIKSKNGEKITQNELIKSGLYSRVDATSHDACPSIWKDVNKINNDTTVEYIIIIDNFTYRIGTKQECEEYASKFKDKALKAFNRYWNLTKKINKNGQGNVFDKEQFIRSFINDN